MHITIYFGEKPLFLCNEISTGLEPFVHHDDAVFIDELDPHTVKSMIHEMQQEKIHAGVFYHPDLEELKKAFFKKFTVITAAGGLIRNEKNDVLLIFRRGKWDLPKGKLDKNEELADCALREVEEETGVKGARIEKEILTTYHTYHEGARFILKQSHWFLMKAKSEQDFTPQEEEDITEIRWVSEKDLIGYTKNMFPAVRDVLKE
jgi:8-oxo-dGTP pyrophosphatase MutT (NUDIX family)